jgi:transposase
MLLSEREFKSPIERAIFTTVLHRLLAPGSDRQADLWHQDYRIEGTESLQLHHFYRAMEWLGSEIDETGRSTKDLIEERLFALRADLFTRLDLMFFDTTSIYFEGEGGETLGQYGHSKDSRPDLKQMVVGAILDGTGRPICCEMWPGNTTDVKTLIPVAERLKKRFGINNVCIVADRGMVSATTIADLEKMNWNYILGVRMRNHKELQGIDLSNAADFDVVRPKGSKRSDPTPLEVRELRIGDTRYVVCYNEDEAVGDRADREAILAGLREQLKQGSKSLIGNKGYRRYVKAEGPAFAVDEAKIQSEARYDGVYVLRTNTDLPTAEVALKYKQLWMVEDIFRKMKSILGTRPIWHKQDETIRGHVFCSFLALVLVKELQDRLRSRGLETEWKDVLRDVDRLQEVEITQEGHRFLLRTETNGVCGKVFQAVGVALPPTVRQIE